MDYSNYTLVSFGDSFTFGQGLVSVKKFGGKWGPQMKEACNELSYVNMISNRLGVKNTINMAMPGASNAGILSTIRSFYDKHRDTENHLYVIALTLADRDEISSMRDTTGLQHVYDFTYSGWREAKTFIQRNKKEIIHAFGYNRDIYTNVSDTAMGEFMSYYMHKYTMLIKHIHVYNGIIDFLKSRNIKFVIVDLINDAPALNERFNILEEFELDGWRKTFTDDLHIIDNSLVELYYRDLENKTVPQYLNWYTFKNMTEFLGMNKEMTRETHKCVDDYVMKYGKDYLGDIEKTRIPGDGHWNRLGHEIASHLIEDWIRKHYE